MSKSDMILALIEHFSNGNKAQFASRLGISPQGLSTWIKRNTFDTELIFSKCEEISAQWLLTGEGDMLKQAQDADTKNTNQQASSPRHLIPFFDDVTTIGGCNTISATVDGCMPPSDYIDAGDWFHEATAAIRHYGDSMIEYPSGCILALKKVEDMRLILWGHNYVVETSEFRITKRLQKGTESNTIVAYSSNTATYPDGRQIHEPKVIPLDTIRSIWLVLGYVVKEFSSGAVFVQK